MVAWSALPPRMWWCQTAVAPPRYRLHAGPLAFGSLAWADPAGTSAEATLLGQHLRFTWHGGWSRQLAVQTAGDPGPGARYRPSWGSGEDGALLLPDGTRYRWYAPSARVGSGVWVGPDAAVSPVFGNVSDRWEIRVEVACPADADTAAAPVLLLLLGSYLALTDALSRHSPPVLG